MVHHTDMRQIAALLGEVDPIADDKFIRNVKADPVDRHIYFCLLYTSDADDDC